jgi:hypothetical protein
VVEGSIVAEIKAVDHLLPIHQAQTSPSSSVSSVGKGPLP